MPKERQWKKRFQQFGLVGVASLAVIGAWILPAHLWQHPKTVSIHSVAPYQLRVVPSYPIDKEIAFLQERIAHNPTGYMDLISLAHVYIRKARLTGDPSWYLLADQLGRRSLANMPVFNNGAIMVLVHVAQAKHDFAGALKLADMVARSEPGNENVFGNLTTIYLALGRLEDANKASEILIQNNPGVSSFTERGLVHYTEGKDQLALADFRYGISLEQTGETEASALARAFMGRLYFKRGQLDKAQNLYQEALHIQPGLPLILGLLGDVELQKGHYRSAERHYNEAFASSQWAAYLLGAAHAAALEKRPQEAARMTNQAEVLLREELRKGSFGHRRDLGRLLLKRGRPADNAEALALMHKEIHIRRDPETMRIWSWALARAGRWHDAQAAMHEVLATGYRDAGMYAEAGQIAQVLGQRAQAAQDFKRALAIDPVYQGDPAYVSFLEASAAKAVEK